MKIVIYITSALGSGVTMGAAMTTDSAGEAILLGALSVGFFLLGMKYLRESTRD